MIIYLDYKTLSEVDPIEKQKRIKKINQLYSDGNEIHVWTEDSSIALEIILQELNSWNCQFTHIKNRKPVYDILIDDKTDKSIKFFE